MNAQYIYIYIYVCGVVFWFGQHLKGPSTPRVVGKEKGLCGQAHRGGKIALSSTPEAEQGVPTNKTLIDRLEQDVSHRMPNAKLTT